MAYATLLSLTQTLEMFLCADDDDDQVPVLHLADRQIIASLHGKLSFLLSFLEDTPLKYGEMIKSLEENIRDAVYQAQGIIESHLSSLIRSEPKIHHVHGGIQKTLEEIDSILEEAVKMKDRIRTVDVPRSRSFRVTTSPLISSSRNDLVGFEEKLMEIKDQLIRGPSKCQIISIVGMGGIGKTTLAKTIYDDSLIVRHFDTRAWATVSLNYNVKQILICLLNSMKNLSHGSDSEDKEKLAERLYKSLKGQRYLIIMDDLWDTNSWEEVRRLFPDDNTGSRIILTTRILDVAVSVNSSSPIVRPSLLSSGDSWKLLCQKIFGTEPCPPQLEETGKEIAENCKGLPLALVVIGGLLYKAERTVEYWMYVKQNVGSLVTDTDDQFSEILSVSYNQLPHHLRACFLYMGTFPEDFEISKSKLTQLWVAEGFIKPDSSKSLEELAEMYLNDLVDRNMIQIRRRSGHNYLAGYSDEKVECGIHDLMRDLCVRLAEKEKFLQAVISEIEISPHRTYNLDHLISHSDSHDHLADIYGSHVRSLVCFNATSQNTRRLSRILSFGQPRVLDAEDICLDTFPDKTVELVDLRYLSFHSGKNKLPSLIFKFLNLQTLRIDSEDTLILPLEIWKMRRLRHVLTKRCFLPYPSAAQSEKSTVLLENLQTLKGVKNFKFTKEVLEIMPNLKTLDINFSHESSTESADLSSYCMDGFVHLHQLEDLYCTFEGNGDSEYQYHLLDNFALPTSLRKLYLNGYRLSSENMAIIGSLPSLETLRLDHISFDGLSWEPGEGEFQQLKYLLLASTDLKYWTADETNFPNLMILTITCCFNLIGIPSGIGNIPTLELIELLATSCSASDSATLIQKEQWELGNDSLAIMDIDMMLLRWMWEDEERERQQKEEEQHINMTTK